MASDASLVAESVVVDIHYLSNSGGVFYNLAHGEATVRFSPHAMRVTNARQMAEPPELERNGFVLVRQLSAVGDFFDPQQVEQIYIPELETFVRDLVGAAEARIFQTAIRTENGEASGGREPVRFAHCDHPEDSYRVYAERMFGAEEAERRLQRPWMVLNLWRGIRTVESRPLAVCDASSVAPEQFSPTLTYDRPGGQQSPFYGFPLRHSDRHCWFYYPRMQPDELLVFKQFDSRPGGTRATPHSAIVDPGTPPDAPLRVSIEARALVLF